MIVRLGLSVLVASLVWCAAIARAEPPVILPPGTRISEHLLNLPGIENVGRVAPGIYRGAQPLPEGYATLKAMGIRTVVNLRTTHDERAAVEAAGMRYIAEPLYLTGEVDRAAVERVVAALVDSANQPVFVHCRQGRDRTGIVIAAYRLRHGGWRYTDARSEMDAFGFNTIWTNFSDFVRRYAQTIEAK